MLLLGSQQYNFHECYHRKPRFDKIAYAEGRNITISSATSIGPFPNYYRFIVKLSVLDILHLRKNEREFLISSNFFN